MATAFKNTKDNIQILLTASTLTASTTVNVSVADAALLPSVPFYATLVHPVVTSSAALHTRCIVTAVNGGTGVITITRNYDSATGGVDRDYVLNDYLALTLHAKQITDIHTAVNTLENELDGTTGFDPTLANNRYLKGKEVGGTARNIAGINTSDQVVLGNTTSLTRINNKLKFRAYISSAQAISAGIMTIVHFNSETFDNSSTYDNATNYRWTPGVVGDYLVNGHFTSDSTASMLIVIHLNGGEYARGTDIAAPAASQSAHVTDIVHITAITDYIDIRVFNAAGAFNAVTGSNQSYFSGVYLSD
jgi:hypothetical protein